MKKELKSLLQSIGQVLVGGVSDRRLLIEDSKLKERLITCSDCPELESRSLSCKACGCKVEYKARLKHTSCPRGKWK